MLLTSGISRIGPPGLRTLTPNWRHRRVGFVDSFVVVFAPSGSISSYFSPYAFVCRFFRILRHLTLFVSRRTDGTHHKERYRSVVDRALLRYPGFEFEAFHWPPVDAGFRLSVFARLLWAERRWKFTGTEERPPTTRQRRPKVNILYTARSAVGTFSATRPAPGDPPTPVRHPSRHRARRCVLVHVSRTFLIVVVRLIATFWRYQLRSRPARRRRGFKCACSRRQNPRWASIDPRSDPGPASRSINKRRLIYRILTDFDYRRCSPFRRRFVSNWAPVAPRTFKHYWYT